MNETKKLILIDGNALMHRAYHALPPLTTKNGEMVNAVYGFTSVLLRVIKELKPDYMVCAFDVAGGTFRDKIFSEYKAGRKKPDQEFYDQIPKIKEVVKALNIPIIEKQGFEADDVIGTLALQANQKFIKHALEEHRGSKVHKACPRGASGVKELKTIIVTGDLDVLQLVNKNTEVFTLRKGIKDTIIYDEKAVKERYDLTPGQIIDYKGLRGDPSDNIPGVKGIGEKGAIELLRNFGSIEKLYEAIEKNKTGDLIKPKVIEKLIAQKKEALMSKELATIKCDMEIEFNLENSIWGDYDKMALNKLFQELEFYSLIDRVDEANHNGAESEKLKTQNNGEDRKYVRYIILNTDEKVDKFLAELKRQKRFVFQTRSSEDDVSQRDLTGIVFLWENSPIYFVPLILKDNKPNLFNAPALNSWLHSPDRAVEPECKPFTKRLHRAIATMEPADALEKLKPILEDESYKKIGYFFKRDIENLHNHNIDIKGLEFDIMIAAYLLDPGKRDYSKNKIIFDYLGHKDSVELKNELRTGSIQEYGANNDSNTAIQQYNNIIYFFELHKILKEKLEEEGMSDLFYKIEMPLAKTLVKMEINGVNLDIKLLKVLSGELLNKIIELEEKIHTLSGDDNFNINSSQQLSQVLFEKMKLPTANIKKNQTGYSTAAPELEKLKEENIIISFISEYKELVKLKNTYVDALPKLVSKKTGRLHTTFNQTVTATGRLSSSNPNLQNIPIRTEFGRKIRKAFICESGRKLVSFDYSQIELRVIAMVSDDKKMKEIFNKGLDIHSATAAEVNQVPLEEVTAQMRRSAKALNFGVIYGMGVYGFAQSAGIERDKAKEFIENYMKKFSSVALYIEKSKEDAKKIGYAETIWGRKRYLPELNSSNGMVRSAAERMAINMPIQGAAADIIKIAMLKVDEWIEEYNNENGDTKEAELPIGSSASDDKIKLLLQVHDELLFSIKEENVPEVARKIKEIMENGHLSLDGKKIDFPVPIVVDIKAGDNWEEMMSI